MKGEERKKKEREEHVKHNDIPNSCGPMWPWMPSRYPPANPGVGGAATACGDAKPRAAACHRPYQPNSGCSSPGPGAKHIQRLIYFSIKEPTDISGVFFSHPDDLRVLPFDGQVEGRLEVYILEVQPCSANADKELSYFDVIVESRQVEGRVAVVLLLVHDPRPRKF